MIERIKTFNRPKIAAGNWKMNLDLSGSVELAESLATGFSPETQKPVSMILAVPYPFLSATKSAIQNNPNVHLAAQNLHHEDKGAYTGEVSASMLKSVGCTHVIICLLYTSDAADE